ncbi:hypothetical protein [Nannocystis radixulma]|uniref:Uncharacterized protein n=1 Tax=Nannocystis radixulma TaxID=2995305 RepID=A0ABT5BPA4_9BACT|nr:hypothetical protein [Nannocystis radixulma]MDC0675528.1 hypothetical protein [Nannocystis radixulma]
MTYDAAIWIPVIFLFCIAGWVLIRLGRPFAAAVLADCLALVFLVSNVKWGFVHHWYGAQGSHDRAMWALGLLLWTLPFLVVAGVGAHRAKREREVSFALVFCAALPSLVLLVWIAAGLLA